MYYTRVLSSLVAAASLLLCLAGPAAAQEARRIRGRVVDAEGAPVAHVRLGTLWEFEEGTATPKWRSDVHSRANPVVRTDDAGTFAADLYFRGRPVALFALDPVGGRGGIATVTKENIDEEQVVTLQPLVRLQGSVEIAQPELAGSSVYVYAFDTRAPIAIARSILPEAGEFSFRVPAGDYKLTVSAKDLQRATREVRLASGTGALDLGTIGLFATNLAEHYGKPPPPWNVTEARGVATEIELSDYVGKWVLIEFWSYW